MRAVTFEGADELLKLQDIPRPEPGSDQLLLKVKACGICGSDLHAYQTAMSPVGNVFGHEFAGEVVAVGPNVTGDWNIGDRAVSLGAITCGDCEKCKAGQPDECDALQLIGFNTPGAYAEYVIAQASNSTKIPDGIADEQAALVEPLAVGLAAFRDCQLSLGGNILIIGAGVIGITVAKWARFFGAGHIGISDLETARLERASKAGATHTINASECSNPVQAFLEATGAVPEVIVECVGRPMLQQLIDIAPRGVHIVAVGATMEPEQVLSAAAAQKKIRMTFSFGYGLEDFDFIIRMLDSGRLESHGLITQKVSLDQVPQTFASLLKANEHCKIMIEP